MNSPPVANPGSHAVYTGGTTSWPMVATTCVSALLVVLMGALIVLIALSIFLPILTIYQSIGR